MNRCWGTDTGKRELASVVGFCFVASIPGVDVLCMLNEPFDITMSHSDEILVLSTATIDDR